MVRSECRHVAVQRKQTRRGSPACSSLWAAIAAIFCLAAPVAASASSFQISPVLVELQKDKATAVLTITNADQAPVSVRILARSWKQVNGVDVYEDTQDLIFSPPIVTVKPGAKQIIRIGQRSRDRSSERAYRLIVEEIVSQTSARTGVTMALRVDLPMYSMAAEAQKGELRWTASRDASGRIIVEAANTGGSRVDLLELGVRSGDAKPVMVSGRVGVVLANSSKRWTIDAGQLPSGKPLNLIFRRGSDAKSSQIPLQLR
jgi:fimbrial chaperone protein